MARQTGRDGTARVGAQPRVDARHMEYIKHVSVFRLRYAHSLAPGGGGGDGSGRIGARRLGGERTYTLLFPS
ncbi:hypothetical protein B296_00006848 [Ensete ventricosum]|uniref:Uncharacterized protein n=1 Tax=Ensete ventricosum TaxID=4639 RepID=A0A426Y9M4_ENSVE|nr:hypothetical protein B296_00006848 [Ensete ventricosum]